MWINFRLITERQRTDEVEPNIVSKVVTPISYELNVSSHPIPRHLAW